jgi:hypothetical protein
LKSRRLSLIVMLSDDSDLTELSPDEVERPTKPKDSKKKAGYRLRNVLKPGRTTQYTAKALYGKQTRISHDFIKLNIIVHRPDT